MAFLDREDAGRQLALLLTSYSFESPCVFGLPRGGVVVAYEVARHLNAPLDVLVARKLGAPMQPELGIGAIAPGGICILDEQTVEHLKISPLEIEEVVWRETAEMERRLQLYRGNLSLQDLSGQTAIIVDDGLATGVTARAAIRSIRLRNPRKVVLAVPVCAQESATSFGAEVDDLICLQTPSDFRAVGLWYENFEQTSDEEVIALLRQWWGNSDGE